MKYNYLLDYAINNQSEFDKKLMKIKKKRQKSDSIVHSMHNEVFRKIDCMQCANCCKTTSPIFTKNDITRIANKQKIKEKDFINQYLKIDDENDYVLKSSPCAFLQSDNSCIIYEYRPKACSEYPHTNRKNFYQITELSSENYKICPAVSEILKKIEI